MMSRAGICYDALAKSFIFVILFFFIYIDDLAAVILRHFVYKTQFISSNLTYNLRVTF